MFWLENLKEKDYLEDIGVDERIILKWILSGMVRPELDICLRIQTGGGFLCTR